MDLIYTIKFTQPPILCQLFHDPPPPSEADIISGSSPTARQRRWRKHNSRGVKCRKSKTFPERRKKEIKGKSVRQSVVLRGPRFELIRGIEVAVGKIPNTRCRSLHSVLSIPIIEEVAYLRLLGMSGYNSILKKIQFPCPVMGDITRTQ